MEERDIDLQILERHIRLIREAFPNAIHIAKNGSCIRFAMVLKNFFPKGKILYDQNHAIFELHGRYFDITGEVSIFHNKENFLELTTDNFGIELIDDLLKLRYDK